MKKLLTALILIGLLVYCGDSDPVPEPEPDDVKAPAVTTISLDDITNNGDGSDLEVSFTRVGDETKISEYRVFVVKSSVQSGFDLAAAESASADNYHVVQPDGTSKQFSLPSSSTDSGGDAIAEAVNYVVFVMTVADGENAQLNALSSASSEISLAQTTIKITYIGNDGVHITDGEKGVIIDALPGNLTNWNPVASGIQSKIENGQAPFDDIQVAMVSHNHADHVSSTSINTFLLRHMSASFLAPPQVRASISGTTGQIASLNLDVTEVKDTVINQIPIQIIRITHFNPQDGTDFASTTENYAFIVELGGLKILHIGDGDLSTDNFSGLDLDTQGIDVALLPTFNFSGQLTTTNRDVLLNEIAPANIIGLHLFSTTPVTDVTNIYPDATVFNESLQFIRY